MTTPSLPEAAKLARKALSSAKGYESRFEALAALDVALAASAEPMEPKPVYLIATGEFHGGYETYTRHDSFVPLSEYETLYATPSAQAEPSAQEPARIELAVRWLEKRRDDYVHEFGSYDPETGATEYGRGAKGQAREEYVAELEEVIEGIRALAACDVPPAGWSCSRWKGHEGPCAATPQPLPPSPEQAQAKQDVQAVPLLWLNPKVVDESTGKMRAGGALTWSESCVGNWTLPLYTAPRPGAAPPVQPLQYPDHLDILSTLRAGLTVTDEDELRQLRLFHVDRHAHWLGRADALAELESTHAEETRSLAEKHRRRADEVLAIIEAGLRTEGKN